MLFVKTLFLAVLGFGAMTFAAPVDADAADAAALQAIQDRCDRIPSYDRHNYRECEHDRRHGDYRDECHEIRKSGGRC